jgi:hypothetical protein
MRLELNAYVVLYAPPEREDPHYRGGDMDGRVMEMVDDEPIVLSRNRKAFFQHQGEWYLCAGGGEEPILSKLLRFPNRLGTVKVTFLKSAKVAAIHCGIMAIEAALRLFLPLPPLRASLAPSW